MISAEERAKLKAENEPQVELMTATYFEWTWRGVGFGQMSFSMDKETGAIHMMDEFMSRDDVRRIMIAYANHLADVGILEGDKPPYRIEQMPTLKRQLEAGLEDGTLNVEGEKNDKAD